MASFQIGQPGVSALLQSLLRDLHAVMEMDDFIHVGIEMELKEMKELLLGFECVLLDGERKRQDGVRDAERWMDNLKDLFYDIDDLLDEVKMEKQQSEVSSYNQIDGCSTQKNIKSMLDQVLDILRKRTEEVINPLQLKRDAGQHNSIWLESQATVRQKPGCYADEPSIHGREEDKKRIIERLLADDGGERRRNYEFVCVVGMGGLGKTTLAQLVFQDETVKRSFAVRSWACISDFFDVIKVTQNLIESAEVNAGKGDGAANMLVGLSALQTRLEEIFRGQKFLLVLDDVWRANVFDELKGPLNNGAKGSKILVTTRLNKVAKGLRSKVSYQLEPLEYAECLKIFIDNAFEEEDDCDNDRGLMKIGEEIVRKCNGVPLVAKVIGAMLTGKDEGEWKLVKDDGIWDLAYEDRDFLPGLRLSYYYLPPYLKRCFEYFALFPTDFKFDQSELVRMWMAEGLIQVKEGREPEEIGNQYYNDLKGRCLIQEDNKIHEMMRHLACIVSGNSFFRDFSGSRSSTSSPQSVRHAFTREVLIDASKLRTLIHEGELRQELFSYKRSRVLDVESKSLIHLPSPGCDLKHLRYLRLTGKFLNSTLPDSICTLTNLQVLDLSPPSSSEEHQNWQINGRFFQLGRSSATVYPDLKNLPEDLGKLINLRFLRLEYSCITDLPESICTLTNLQEVDLKYCKDLKNLPEDVGLLLNLRFLRLERSGIAVLPESICTLTNLQELDLLGCKDLTNLPEDVGKLLNLRFLRLQNSGITVLPDSVCALSNLQVLDFSDYDSLITLPRTMGKLEDLHEPFHQKSSLTYSMPELILRQVLLQESLQSYMRQFIENAIYRYLLGNSSTSSMPEFSVGAINRHMPEYMENAFTSHVLRTGRNLNSFALPANSGNLTKLEKLESYTVVKEEGRGIDQLKDMNMIKGYLKIMNMENIESAQDASTANLRSKKHIEKLEFVWKDFDAALTGRDREMETRVLEALEPNPAIKCLCFQNYVGHKFPSWMSTPPLHNLTDLNLNLPLMAELRGMEFKSLLGLHLSNCPALREVSVTTPQLKTLTVVNCNELIVLQLSPVLKELSIWYCSKLMNLPYGLHDLTSLQKISFLNCPCLEIHPRDPLPPSITRKYIYNCAKLDVKAELDEQEEKAIADVQAGLMELLSFFETQENFPAADS